MSVVHSLFQSIHQIRKIHRSIAIERGCRAWSPYTFIIIARFFKSSGRRCTETLDSKEAMEPVLSSSIALAGTRKRRRAPSSKPSSARPSVRPRKAAAVASSPAPAEDGVALPPSLAAAPPVVSVISAPGANKRPQLKYDPSVPMTKDETSAWRREQRRERNRASAAACRNRQRNRIAELEEELGGWKAKFEEALGRLRGMDAGAAGEVEEAIVLQDSSAAVKTEDGGLRPEAVVSSAPVVMVKQERCTTPPVVASMDVQQQVTPSPR